MTKRRVITLVCIGLFTVVIPVIAGVWLLLTAAPNETFAQTTTIFSELLTPLFSVFAFGGLIYTALLQSEELGLQRQELKETREELAKTAAAQADLVKATQLNGQLATLTALNDYYRSRSSDAWGPSVADKARRRVIEIADQMERVLAELEAESPKDDI